MALDDGSDASDTAALADASDSMALADGSDASDTGALADASDSMALADASDTGALADASDALVLPDGAFTCVPTVVDDAAVGTRFCDLYGEIIAGNVSTGCQTAKCHGGAGNVSNGPKLGWDGASAYAGLTSMTIGWISPPTLVSVMPGGDSRPSSNLEKVLSGVMLIPRMPFGGPFLSADQTSRVDAWLARGAPFD